MSLTWVESIAPLIDEECIIDALEARGVQWERQANLISRSEL